MLFLLTLFLGIFQTDFCILYILSQFLKTFHYVLEEKCFTDETFFFLYKQCCVFDLTRNFSEMHPSITK